MEDKGIQPRRRRSGLRLTSKDLDIPERLVTQKNRSEWLNPFSVIELRNAIEEEATGVKLGGRDFLIRYEGERFYIKPVKGYAPCGWFTKKEINTWLETHAS